MILFSSSMFGFVVRLKVDGLIMIKKILLLHLSQFCLRNSMYVDHHHN